MIRKYVAFITCLILIYWMRSIIYFILALFRFVLYFAVDILDNATGITDINGIFDANTIAYKILDAEKVFNGTALIDETIARSKEAALRNLYFVPWVIAWVSKLGIVVIVMENAVRLLTYVSVYVLSISDVVHGLKDSRLINYTKNTVKTRICIEIYTHEFLTCIQSGNIIYIPVIFFHLAIRFLELRTVERLKRL